MTASSSHGLEKTGVPSTLSATPAGVTTLPRAELFITKHWGSGDNPRVCDWRDADTCDSPSIGVPKVGAESLTKREFHFFVLARVVKMVHAVINYKNKNTLQL